MSVTLYLVEGARMCVYAFTYIKVLCNNSNNINNNSSNNNTLFLLGRSKKH